MKRNKVLGCIIATMLLILSACNEPAYYNVDLSNAKESNAPAASNEPMYYSVDADIFTYNVVLNKRSYACGDTLVAQVTMMGGVQSNGTLTSPDSILSHVIRAYIECNGEQIAECIYAGEPCDGKETTFWTHPGDKLETTVMWELSGDYKLYSDDKLMLVLDTERYIGEIPITLSGYSKRKPIILTQDDIITEFHLHFDGCWNIYQHYDIVPYGDTWRLKYEISEGEGGLDNHKVLADCIVNDETVQAVSEVLAKYQAGRWNFYDETAEGVMDGGGFSLNVTYPGVSIRAKGWNEFPDGLFDASDEIKAIFEQFIGKIEF